MKIKGVQQFLADYPGMSLRPTRDNTIISGVFSFNATGIGKEVEDSYELEISVNKTFPTAIPDVRETAGKIPKSGGFHVNPNGTLCLGSYLRLKKALYDSPDLVSFAEKCVVPYLFNVSIKLVEGGDFVTGELPHGTAGIIQDYMELFELPTTIQIINSLKLLGMKKRIANKKICPCGCGIRLGKCALHQRLNSFRPAAPRSWFSKHAREVETAHYG